MEKELEIITGIIPGIKRNLSTLNRKEKLEEAKKKIDKQFNYEKILLDYNIVDFICK